MEKKYILVDGNSVAFMHQSSKHKLKAGDLDTTTCYGMIQTVRTLILQNQGYRPIILWDGKNNWRKQDDSSYKGNRDKNKQLIEIKKQIFDQFQIVLTLFKVLGVEQLWGTELEADDIAGYHVRTYPDAKHLLVTGDQDWLQLVNENVSWLDLVRSRSCDHTTFKDFTGYENGRQFLESKALIGDRGDNLGGVKNIGKERAYELLMQYGSLQGLCIQHVKDPSKITKPYFREIFNNPSRTEEYVFNYEMMNLLEDPPHFRVKDKLQTIEPDFDPKFLYRLMNKLAFHSLTENFDRWLEPYNYNNVGNDYDSESGSS